jgi:hypothetical protein
MCALSSFSEKNDPVAGPYNDADAVGRFVFSRIMPSNRIGCLEQNGHYNPQLSRVAGDYCERPAPARLRSAVQVVWKNLLRSTGRPVLFVPDGCIDLVWTGNALFVAGPDTGPVMEAVPPDAVIVGIRFRPGEARHWLNVSSLDLANARLPLADLWKGRAQEQAHLSREVRRLSGLTPAAVVAQFAAGARSKA